MPRLCCEAANGSKVAQDASFHSNTRYFALVADRKTNFCKGNNRDRLPLIHFVCACVHR